jgi:hypothetical protein
MKILNDWYEGLIYPFKEKDWKSKMWLIPLLGVFLTPFIELLVLRGWRVELVRNIGLNEERILPKAGLTEVIKYAFHGVKLYLITAIYLIVPIIVFKYFGINPFRQLIAEVGNIFSYLWDNNTGLSWTTLLWGSFWAIMKELFIKNVWLVFYYPYYRTATIRYALTGKFRNSHLAFLANVKFIIRNIIDFIVMVVNQIADFIILFFINAVINIILTPFIGYFLAPLIFFYAGFWTSGYEYGQIARKMREQEYPEMVKGFVVGSVGPPPLTPY